MQKPQYKTKHRNLCKTIQIITAKLLFIDNLKLHISFPKVFLKGQITGIIKTAVERIQRYELVLEQNSKK